jgi:hypothetical protein
LGSCFERSSGVCELTAIARYRGPGKLRFMSARVDAKPFLQRQLQAGPLLFWRDGPGETREGMLWFVTTCTNPLCSCRDATIEISSTDDRLLWVEISGDTVREGHRTIDGRAPALVRRARIFVDVDSGHLEKHTKDGTDPALVRWARDQLDAVVLAVLQERFAEGKKIGSSELVLEFERHLWAPGDLLPYAMVHPKAVMEIAFEGRRFLADDHHCVRPGCDCNEVVVEFHVIDESTRRAERVGAAWLYLDNSKPVNVDAVTAELRELLLSLCRELKRVDPGLKELGNRKLRMHALAPELHRRVKPSGSLRAPDSKARPNGPCPCGSGRKYKKCCLNGNGPVRVPAGKSPHGQ